MPKIEKLGVPVIVNDKNEPIALIYFSQDRERIIYLLKKADEDEIINLFNLNNDKNINCAEGDKDAEDKGL